MNKFETIHSHAVLLARDHIDTDQIIPARFLKVVKKSGLGEKLFHDWRYSEAGQPRAEFVLNDAASRGARVLVAGENFGCGSSREHAPWALVDWGFRVIVACSFADIFRNNATKNGLLPVQLDRISHAAIIEILTDLPQTRVTVDLERCEITAGDQLRVGFEIDPFARHCLLEGVDQLGYILSFESDIAAFEARRGEHRHAVDL
jgi:3-isopropylmalate/(R)-2-methylmalate dehydratase small subunit